MFFVCLYFRFFVAFFSSPFRCFLECAGREKQNKYRFLCWLKDLLHYYFLHQIEIVQSVVVLHDLSLDLRGIHPGDEILKWPRDVHRRVLNHFGTDAYVWCCGQAKKNNNNNTNTNNNNNNNNNKSVKITISDVC